MNGPSFHDVQNGQDVVIRKYGQPERFAVASPEFDRHGGLAGLTLSDGGRISFSRRIDEDPRLTDVDGVQWWPYYTLPLPNGSETDRVEYARILRGEPSVRPKDWRGHGEWDETCAFLVEDVDAAHISARMFSRQRAWSYKNGNGEDELSYEALNESDIVLNTVSAEEFWITENAAFLDRAVVPDVEPGDVIVSTGIQVVIEDGLEITRLTNACRLPFKTTRERLGDVFPITPACVSEDRVFPDREHLRLSPAARWVFERECARYATEPDMALLVVIPDTENPKADSERIGIIAFSGQVTYRNRGAVSEGLMSSGGIQPGIALMTAPRFWSYRSHEGEYDGGFEFEAAPATVEDLDRFSIGVEALASSVRGFLDEEEDASLCALADDELWHHFMSIGRQEIEATPSSARLGRS